MSILFFPAPQVWGGQGQGCTGEMGGRSGRGEVGKGGGCPASGSSDVLPQALGQGEIS